MRLHQRTHAYRQRTQKRNTKSKSLPKAVNTTGTNGEQACEDNSAGTYLNDHIRKISLHHIHHIRCALIWIRHHRIKRIGIFLQKRISGGVRVDSHRTGPDTNRWQNKCFLDKILSSAFERLNWNIVARSSKACGADENLSKSQNE